MHMSLSATQSVVRSTIDNAIDVWLCNDLYVYKLWAYLEGIQLTVIEGGKAKAKSILTHKVTGSFNFNCAIIVICNLSLLKI